MPNNISHKDRVLEIYNAEIGALEMNINAKTQNKTISKGFEKKIDNVLGYSLFKTKEKNIQEFLDLYQEKLRNYDTDYPKGNQEKHGIELTGILLTLREALNPKPDQKFNKDTWKDLKIQFTEYRKKEGGPIKTMNEQVKELRKSVKDIHEHKNDKRLAEILQQDFNKDKSRKTSKDDGYSDYFYVDIHKEIKDNNEFDGVKTSIKERVTKAEKRIDELEEKKNDEVIKYFIDMVDANKITREQLKVKVFSDAVKTKIATLFNQEVVSTEDASRRSSAQTPTVALGASVAEPPPSGGTDMETKEKAKTEKEIFEKKVTVGAEVAAIGGAALLGAVTIGTGGLFLPIAVGVGTVVAGAIAINEQDRIGKQTKQEKEDSKVTFAEVIQEYVVDNPSREVTKRVIDFGEGVRRTTFGINQAKDDKGSSIRD